MKRDLFPSLGGAFAIAPIATGTWEWRRAMWTLAFVLAMIFGAYGQTGYHMVETWSHSETFAHGFVVPLIVAWLIWRTRHLWMAEVPRPSPIWAIPVAACGLAWLCGEVATINAISQLAFVGTLVSAVPLVLGTRVAWRMAFPLAFLFFAVPIGDFMMPTLMRWTADFTVYALRLTGVPVNQDGQQIIIPSGRWSVVEACSGIRYLIASLMVGALYAYVSFSSLWRRLVFIGVSIVIPIVANWVRAYLIVMIGHLSSNRLAVGIDHLIYGWLFFGLVMFLMFWAGRHWTDEAPMPEPAPSVGLLPMTAISPPTWAFLVLAFATTVTWPLALRAIGERMAGAGPVTLDPLRDTAGWHAEEGGLESWQPVIQSPSAVLRQTFSNGGREVGAHIAFFRNQSHERKLVNSTNVLGSAGLGPGASWAIVAEKPTNVTVGARTFSAKISELVGPRGQRLIALRWYWIDGRVTASDYLAKAYTFLSRLHGRDGGAIVIVYAKEDTLARQTLDDFLRDAGSALEPILRRAAATP